MSNYDKKRYHQKDADHPGRAEERARRLENKQLYERGMRRCPTCKIIFAIENFHVGKEGVRAGACSFCRSSATPETKARKAKRAELLSMENAHEFSYCGRCMEIKPINEFWTSRTCKQCDRATSLFRKYNITQEYWDTLFESQGRTCGICHADHPGTRGWATDHDHACCPRDGRSCGKCIRGILCTTCNMAIGLFKDDTSTLRSAIDYLDNR